jgi:alkylated DNA nucleotide flippase Atl1
MATGAGEGGERDVLQGAPLIMRIAGGTWRVPTTSSWQDEGSLHEILQVNPTLLPGITAPETVAISEFPIYGSGRVDILAVEPDGALTLCEVKLKRNPEIRRQVLGQVLAYAAGLTAMSYEEVDREVATRRKGVSLAALVLGDDADPSDIATFRAAVTAHLRAGRFRLVLAVDELTDELRNSIDYLAQHTDGDMELVAIEVAYASDGEVEVLVPRVWGSTVATKRAPGSSSAPTRIPLEEAGAIVDAAELAHTGAGALVARLFEELGPHLSYLYVGDGDPTSGQGCVVVADAPVRTQPLAIRPALRSPGLRICFDWMRALGDQRLHELLETLERNAELAPLLAEVAAAHFRKRPLIPFVVLGKPGVLDEIIAALKHALRPIDSGEDIEPIPESGFDPERVHAILRAIPVGRWTTYGEVAQIVGTGAQALGAHIRSCAECPNAARVLPVSGEPSAGFKRSDPTDLRTQREELESEGIRFTGNAADRTQRIGVSELAQLARAAT